MMTAKDDRRAELEAELAGLDDDDESDEVTVGRPDGSTFKGTFRRAVQLGFLTKLEPKTPDKNDGGDTAKRFTSGRRTG
jgi:hypothetical protein